MLTEDVLVISQKAKLIETMNEYEVFDGVGATIGAIRELEQSMTMRAFQACRRERPEDRVHRCRELAFV